LEYLIGSQIERPSDRLHLRVWRRIDNLLDTDVTQMRRSDDWAWNAGHHGGWRVRCGTASPGRMIFEYDGSASKAAHREEGADKWENISESKSTFSLM
jgi:hypothetical protein